ncbi:MAG: hypothetical protein PUG40_05355 [Berryella intestinalis]|nr:hypothetical protein [Berryella intestinalis]
METSYFHCLKEQKRLLACHGFDHWLDEGELLSYLFGLEDKIDAFCGAMGFTMARDYRGRWYVCRVPQKVDSGDRYAC